VTRLTPKESVDAAVVAYVNGGMPALQELTGPDPVESPVFWEAVSRIGANRRALQTGRYRQGGVDRWEQLAAAREEQHDDDRHEWKGGNV
jgi:hypothetical protein